MSDRPPVVSSNDNRVDGLVRRSFDPALTIDVNSLAMPRTFAVYILASLSGRLYVGVTGDLLSRLHEHRTAQLPSFTARCRITRLVHFEQTPNVRAAIERETEQIPRASRSAKARSE